jgi:hypothetical protein
LIAIDSKRVRPPSTSAGMRQFGLIFRYSGFFESPTKLTGTFSYSTPISSSAQSERKARDIGIP